MSSSRRPHNLRQPVSCRPCRRRKIRCGGNAAPCNTCQRRGCASSCVYENDSTGIEEDGLGEALPAVNSNQALVSRIHALESIVSQFVLGQSTPAPTSQDILTPPSSDRMSSVERFSTRDSATRSLDTSPSHAQVGTLDVSPDGYVSFRPGRVHIQTALALPDGDSPEKPRRSEQGHFMGGFPFESALSTRAELLAFLPPAQQCKALLDVYFRVFSTLFHILYDPHFFRDYQAFQTDSKSTPLTFIALLYVMLAISVTALRDDDPLVADLNRSHIADDNIRSLSERYRALAMRSLAADGILWRHNVQGLQALVLLVYAINHSQGCSWPLLGMTFNIALALGCHIDPAKLGLGRIECEERRRAWAGVLMLHTIQNVGFGSFSTFSESFSVLLPADVDDANLHDEYETPIPNGPTQMSYLLFKFKLYQLSARITAAVVSRDGPDSETVLRLDQEISHEQEMWNVRYLADSFSHSAGPLSQHQMQLHILDCYSNQMILLVHRPYFAGPKASQYSFTRCVKAANSIIASYEEMCDAPRFGEYRWYTFGLASFYAFHAAIVLMYLLSDPTHIADHAKIYASLARTLEHFQSAERRSPICERAAESLDRLLTRVPRLWESEVPSNFEISNTPPPPVFDEVFELLAPEQWLSPATQLAWASI